MRLLAYFGIFGLGMLVGALMTWGSRLPEQCIGDVGPVQPRVAATDGRLSGSVVRPVSSTATDTDTDAATATVSPAGSIGGPGEVIPATGAAGASLRATPTPTPTSLPSTSPQAPFQGQGAVPATPTAQPAAAPTFGRADSQLDAANRIKYHLDAAKRLEPHAEGRGDAPRPERR